MLFSMKRERLLSGIKPTGRIHIGNYFGAIKQLVDLQKRYETFIFIADYHALTTLHDPSELRKNIIDITLDYLAVGIDPTQATIFKQSSVSQHAELAWIFSCITTMPYLMRAHAYKDAKEKNKEINVGTFTYPILMAADILLYNADHVPVGSDQKQHIEIARNTTLEFNRTFGETFSVPEPVILDNVKTVPGTDGRKMSKSYQNTIPLFASPEEIEKGVMSIPTDSKGKTEPKDPETCTIFSLHKLFLPPETLDELRKRYQEGDIGYHESKEMLIAHIEKFIAPLRTRRSELEKEKRAVEDILNKGAQKAQIQAEKTMSIIRKKIGVTLA